MGAGRYGFKRIRLAPSVESEFVHCNQDVGEDECDACGCKVFPGHLDCGLERRRLVTHACTVIEGHATVAGKVLR